MYLLSAAEGHVCRLPQTDELRPAVITFLDAGFDYQSLHVIVNATGLELKTSYQISDTIGGNILMVTFGESISSVPVQGVILTSVCDSDFADDEVGRVVDWWQDKNLTNNRLPVLIRFAGNRIFKAYVGDLNLSAQDPETKLWQFSMSMLRIPEREPVRRVGDSPAPQLPPIPEAIPEQVPTTVPNPLIPTVAPIGVPVIVPGTGGFPIFGPLTGI